LCCGLWTSPQRRQRYRRGIIAGRPPTRAGPPTRSRREPSKRGCTAWPDFDRLADAADSAAQTRDALATVIRPRVFVEVGNKS
jgi:hypothetical protein